MGRFIFLSSGLLVVFLSLSGTGADQGCLSDWSSREGYCYKIFKEKKTWADAEKFCTEVVKGGHLISFRSSEEVDFMAQLTFPELSYNFVWIGLRDFSRDCQWRWIDHSKLFYKAWSDEPNCFVCKTRFRTWDALSCGDENPFICKSRLPH